jgi:hypothetical protein
VKGDVMAMSKSGVSALDKKNGRKPTTWLHDLETQSKSAFDDARFDSLTSKMNGAGTRGAGIVAVDDGNSGYRFD